VPLVREINFNNAEEITEEGLPLMIMFHKKGIFTLFVYPSLRIISYQRTQRALRPSNKLLSAGSFRKKERLMLSPQSANR